MSDAFTDANGKIPVALDERIRFAKSEYLSRLWDYLSLVKVSLDKRRRASAEKHVFRSAARWDDLAGGSVSKELPKTLKSLVNADQSAWACLLCSIDFKIKFYDFVSISPFSFEGLNVIECNGDSIRLLHGEFKDLLQKALPARCRSMSQYLVVSPGIERVQLVVFPGK